MIIFDTISSGGQRDYSIDLTNRLEPAELLTEATVTSKNLSRLTVSNKTIDADGKKINFHVTIASGARPSITELEVAFTGNSGSVDTYRINQPIVEVLTN